MRRGDVAVMSISTALAAIVVAAVVYSVGVLDRTSPVTSSAAADTDSSVLVVTWGPSLCRVEKSNRGCASGHVGELGRMWILHGLWPQPRDNEFCGVPEELASRARNTHGTDIPTVEISDSLNTDLQSLMSDSRVLVPHEWYTHGTCSGVTPEAYFGAAVALTDQARAVLDPLFSDAEGERFTQNAVRERFDDAFGPSAGERVGLTCRNVTGEGRVIYEIQLSLPPVAAMRAADGPLSLGDQLAKGPPIPGTCHSGHVL